MTKAKDFRSALGLTQEETAMLLQITQSQLAMFEIGQRDLPPNALLQLVQMYNHVNNKEQEKWKHPIVLDDNARIREMILQELRDNEHAQLLLQRKIDNLKKKCQKNLSALLLAEYLQSKPQEHENIDTELAEIIRRKAIEGIEKNGVPAQTKHTLKLTALQHYQKELQKKLSSL